MELRNVKKVEEIGSAEILNYYLEKGWNLIDIPIKFSRKSCSLKIYLGYET